MPQVEINSPLPSTEVEEGFCVTGWTDPSNQLVTCSVEGPTHSETLSATSDGFGNWSTEPTSVPIGENYTIRASITVDTDTYSDVIEGIEVCSGIDEGDSPIPIVIEEIIELTASVRSNRRLTVSGQYSEPDPDTILVLVVQLQRRKVRVFSAKTVDNPADGEWTIDNVIAPPAANKKRTALLAIRLKANGVMTGQNSMRL